MVFNIGNRTQFLLTNIFLILILFADSTIWAVDGLTRNAINARYEALAGANTALGGSPVDVALNPANLSLTKGKKVEFGLGNSTIYNRYQDQFLDSNPSYVYNNDKKSRVEAPAPYVALKLPVTDNIDYGVALYIPGGAIGGVEKITRNTPNGQSLNDWSGANLPGPIGDSKQIKESNSNQFAVVKLVNGLSFKIGNLSLGASVEAIYGTQKLNQKYYDITGTVEIPGQGYYYESSKKAFTIGGVVGVNYAVNDRFRIAYSYQAHSSVPLNGHYQIGLNDPNYYRKTGVSYNFDLPEKHSLGFSYGPENIKIALDFIYTNYGSYLKKANQKLEDPWLPTPFDNLADADAHLNFRNQGGVLVGFEHKLSDSWIYRLGYSYNSLAIKSNGLSGTTGGFFSVYHVFAGGISYLFDKWSLDLGVSYNGPKNHVTGAKGTDWDFSHSIKTGPTTFNNAGYSYGAESTILAVNIGATKSFD
ncbi:OmpP1/FadL family transporter [Leptospira adleri]|uniref:OmpP1/FadL family transporter n=1 Tax=Leptospira adleri TaxID=2023186 RepID=UPI0010834CAE|nr:outer membrane protein transport protein [Leptospira adleri]TGM53115.1 transporter [Leptospira adleri]